MNRHRFTAALRARLRPGAQVDTAPARRIKPIEWQHSGSVRASDSWLRRVWKTGRLSHWFVRVLHGAPPASRAFASGHRKS